MTDIAGVLAKAAVLWVQTAERTWPLWVATQDAVAYAVTGGSEQPPADWEDASSDRAGQPSPTPEVSIILRTKDTRVPIGPVSATVRRIRPGDDDWIMATDLLLAARQGVPSEEVRGRWTEESAVWAFCLDLQAGSPTIGRDQPSGARPPLSTARPATWRPRPARRLRRPRGGN